jgi:adenosylcobinamide-GDP ribazoletransferase
MRARDPLAAVAFLTRIPVGRVVTLGPDDVGRGVVFFPFVGAAVGALAGLAVEGLDGPLPALVAGGLGVAVTLVLTGALHLDGLADTADAFGAGDRERRLEIMRDSRTGSFGAAAIAVAVLVEAAALGGLAVERDAVRAFVVAGALSRAATPPLARWLPYARSARGPGSVLSGRASALAALAGAAIAVAAAVGLLGWDGVAAAALAGGVMLLAGLGSRAWIGGVTGDILGATTELIEIGVLVLLLGLA